MARKCFISFKTEDMIYKKTIQNSPAVDIVDRSMNEPIDSDNEDYIMRRIRELYLADSTVTIHLIGAHSAERLGLQEQRYIKRELQASLYNRDGNTRNGILGVVLPDVHDRIYRGTMNCLNCGGSHNMVSIDDSTVVKEFSYNYYIPNGKCAHPEEDRYCVLAPWEEFAKRPNDFIEQAFAKRDEPIAEKVRVYGGE